MNRKHLLSCCCMGFFFVLALGSSSSKLGYNSFNSQNHVEDRSEKSNYIEKNDGSRVYGEKIHWKSGALVKDQIQIDGEKYKIPEIRGYREGDSYYGRYGARYIHRIIHGKINVYMLYDQVTSTSTDASGHMHTSTRTVINYYSQRGEDGPMVTIYDAKDLQALVSDCPLAAEMAGLTGKKLRKAIKNDRDYLNNVINVYNNGCKAVE